MHYSLFTSFVEHTKIAPAPRWKKLGTELLKESYQLREVDSVGLQWSRKNYINGYTSYASYGELNKFSSTFGELKKLIDRHVNNFLKRLEYDIKPTQLYMNSCWVNVMPTGTTHSWHIHPLSLISGTVYLQVPTGTSGIKFEDPRLVGLMAAPPRKKKASLANQSHFEIQPQAGDIVLFESWMRHEVPINQSKKDRVSVSFNYSWK